MGASQAPRETKCLVMEMRDPLDVSSHWIGPLPTPVLSCKDSTNFLDPDDTISLRP